MVCNDKETNNCFTLHVAKAIEQQLPAYCTYYVCVGYSYMFCTQAVLCYPSSIDLNCIWRKSTCNFTKTSYFNNPFKHFTKHCSHSHMQHDVFDVPNIRNISIWFFQQLYFIYLIFHYLDTIVINHNKIIDLVCSLGKNKYIIVLFLPTRLLTCLG